MPKNNRMNLALILIVGFGFDTNVGLQKMLLLVFVEWVQVCIRV